MSPPLPTALGWKGLLFHAVLATAFFATPYVNLFFLLLTFLTLLGLLAWFWTLRHLGGVTGGLQEPEPVAAGTHARLAGWIETPGRSRLGLALQVDLGGAAPAGPLRLAAGPTSGRTAVQSATPPFRRGVYPIARAALVTTWPLGLFRARRAVAAPRELVVFPAPAARREAHGGAGPLGELCGIATARGGLLQPSTLREHRPGDPVHRIHWKASARRGELVLQEWEGGAGNGYEVVLDRRTDPETLEANLSALSALALTAREEKETLTLHTQGLSATFGPKARPWLELLKFLAGAEALAPAAAPPPPAAPEVPRLAARREGGRP
ncbi:MAG: DUF58 domain-containing protein [Planctomycetes bacterium]|nr:DUF58 domain-containing protein [Planctomycetota bacterium]